VNSLEFGSESQLTAVRYWKLNWEKLIKLSLSLSQRHTMKTSA